MKKRHSIPMGCLYCGVDSGPVLSFFILLVGVGLLGFVCFFVWGRISGKFNNIGAEELALKAEEERE